MYQKYLAELMGTFTLSFVVLEAVSAPMSAPLPVPVIAALTLGLFVYTIGTFSGCHINPAVTIGLFTLGRTSVKDTVLYLAFQCGGAVAALLLAKFLMVTIASPLPEVFTLRFFVAEALGTALFTFGIAAVVTEKVPALLSGMVVGGSLLLGILVSLLGGSLGILNPAVAFALGVTSFTAIWAPIVGSVVGFQLHHYLLKLEKHS